MKFYSKNRDALRELVAQDLVDKDFVIEACIRYMDDNEVGEMMNSNDILTLDELAEQERTEWETYGKYAA